MKVEAIQMSDLFDQCNDIYTSVVVVAKRAKQIIDERVITIEDTEDVEDSIQIIEPEIVIEDIDKPMVVALEEYLNGELEWRKREQDKPESDEA